MGEITAIPTRYGGALFRSRLEAQWAAFFDLVGWQWLYEPFDLEGWIPDFELTGSIHVTEPPVVLPRGVERCSPPTRVLVEVKPWNGIAEWRRAETRTIERALKQAGYRHREVLLLGSGCPQPIEPFGLPVLGFLLEAHGEEPAIQIGYNDAVVTDYGGHFGFCSSTQSFEDRMTGFYCGGTQGSVRQQDLDRLWREAGNKVQWRAPIDPSHP